MIIIIKSRLPQSISDSQSFRLLGLSPLAACGSPLSATPTVTAFHRHSLSPREQTHTGYTPFRTSPLHVPQNHKNCSKFYIAQLTHPSSSDLVGRMALLLLRHEPSDVWLQTGEFQSHIWLHVDPVALLCFQTNKCGKSSFTVVGGWKRHQHFKSRASQLRMLRLDMDPKVCQTFISESRLQSPI